VLLTTKSSQPTGKTIENTLFKALVEAGAVSQDNSDNPVKVGLHCTSTPPPTLTHMQVNINRAARTDAGVHAAGNVVSMKLISVIPGVPDLVGRINELLPSDIRLWSVVREQLDDTHSTPSDADFGLFRFGCKTRLTLAREWHPHSVPVHLSDNLAQILRLAEIHLFLPVLHAHPSETRERSA
jgi:hypothetical protein